MTDRHSDRRMPEPMTPFTDALRTPPDGEGHLLKRPEKDKAGRGGRGETPGEEIATRS